MTEVRFKLYKAAKAFAAKMYDRGLRVEWRRLNDGDGNRYGLTFTGRVDPDPQPFGAGGTSVQREESRATKRRPGTVRSHDGRERAWRSTDECELTVGASVTHRWDDTDGVVTAVTAGGAHIEWADGSTSFALATELK